MLCELGRVELSIAFNVTRSNVQRSNVQRKRALVCGAGGFIGGHLVKKLKREGYWVRGVDIKEHEFAPPPVPSNIGGAGGQADEFLLLDLREPGGQRGRGAKARGRH